MPPQKDPRSVLEALLGLLSLDCQIEERSGPHGLTLQVQGADLDFLLESGGAPLEDLQLLLNRILQASGFRSGRVQLDVGQWRERRDLEFVTRVCELAEGVRRTGHSVVLDPMNAYERRLVHQLFEGDPSLSTWSPPGDARLKRVTIRVRAGFAGEVSGGIE